VRQGLVEHFQIPNPKPIGTKDHGNFEPTDLYHERVKILDRLRKQIWRNNKVEMRAQIVANVILIFVAPAPNLFHHNNVGVICVGISNFRVELVRSIPLYFVAMPHSMVIVTKIPFTTTLAHTIPIMRSKP
jgi:hypothetical protein